jgi:hypothetical protein
MEAMNGIIKVYSGKKGCMCGCLGKYYYTEHGATEYNPGYDVTDNINLSMVKRIAKRVMDSPDCKQELLGAAGQIMYTDRDGKMECVFLGAE